MAQIEFSDQEQNVLAEILDTSLSQLELEIHRTDRLEFKEALAGRRDILKRLLAKVKKNGG